MPFEYGSQQVDIPNPFRFEGAAYTARAAVLILLGLLALLSVRTLVADGERPIAGVVMVGGLALLGFGVFAAYRGLFKMFRFYVGRGQPADLAATVAAEQSVMPGARSGGSTGFRGLYQTVELANMLLGRKNPTFREPEGWLPRLLHSLVANLIFLPYALRNDAGSRFAAAAHTVVIVGLLGIAWFAGITGLVPMAGTPVMQWLVAVITALLVVIWLREAVRPSRGNRSAVLHFTPFALVLWAAAAIAAPFALVALHGARPLPQLPFSPFPWFLAALLVGGAATAYSLYLAIRRAPREQPPTNVTEYREHWQESVHPMDIFRAIEITLAKHRFQEIPNRVYDNDVPQLVGQGSQNKGEFQGRTLQEVQPRPIADRRGDLLLRVGIAVGQVLLLGAGIVAFALLMQLTTIMPAGLAKALLGAVLLWTAGKLITQTSSLYVSEIEFESDLIAFQATGTFSESKLATGMSIYDSTRSENVIVRSSLTPWLLVSRLHTSTLAVSGSANLEQPRLILGMTENPTLTRDLVADARSFLKDRQIMATVASESDLKAAANIYQMNERTRANVDENGERPVIPHERRDEELLGSDDPAPSAG